MYLTIDNNDGAGGVDYTPALLRDVPLTVTRARGEWTLCRGGLDVLGASLPWPSDRARVTVTDATGAVMFRGFTRAQAVASVSEQTATGLEQRPIFEAVEAAWLTQAAPSDVLQPATAASHVLQLSDAKVTLSGNDAALEELATDVTLTGEHEATAYVTEIFRGDGTTSSFVLAHAPFRESGSATLISDSFDGTSLNAAVWAKTDPGGYLALGAGGLHMGGGSGYDGATVLASSSPVELGGTLVAEANGVGLSTGSDGILLGFYDGSPSLSACIAGVCVSGTGAAHTLAAIIHGVVQPATYSFTDGHAYVIRVRLHCAELQRVRNAYEVLVDGVLQSFGGGSVDAPLHIIIEVVDLGLASSTLPTVLYDGAIASPPQQATFAAVNSTAITGSIASVSLTQAGSAWVVSTATDGSVTTLREGATGTGADYSLTSTGTINFSAGRVPAAGTLLTVSYRRSGRAVARLQDADAQASSQELALPGLPAWSGHVVRPAARSSADCASAAKALLALAAGSATAKSGHAEWIRGTALDSDVSVGDVLRLSDGACTFPVQAVTITDGNSEPELLHYKAQFGQSRAQSLSFTVDAGIAADVSLPIGVLADTASLPSSLSGLQVTSATSTALQIDSGADAPEGGGFEVRRSDANFGSASTADLVLNSPARSFSIPRLAFAERFFVRMYDGATPRNYSAVSSLVLTHLPTS